MKCDFLEKHHFVHVAPSAIVAANEDIFNGDPESDVVSLQEADGIVFMIITNANAAGGNASVYVYACDDTTPANTTPIPFKYRAITGADTTQPISSATSAGFLTSTGANHVYIVEVDAADVQAVSGREFCQLHCIEVTNQTVDGAIIALLTGLRYAGENVRSQVA